MDSYSLSVKRIETKKKIPMKSDTACKSRNFIGSCRIVQTRKDSNDIGLAIGGISRRSMLVPIFLDNNCCIGCTPLLRWKLNSKGGSRSDIFSTEKNWHLFVWRILVLFSYKSEIFIRRWNAERRRIWDKRLGGGRPSTYVHTLISNWSWRRPFNINTTIRWLF